MFRWVARQQYRKAWQAMNRHDYEAIIRQLAPRFEISFIGDTSLGGTRRTTDAMRAWFQRFFRLFPDARFVMQDMAVDGWPWNTRIYGSFEVQATVLGESYHNVFVQAVRLRWGRVTAYRVYEDSLRFWRAAEKMAQRGISEAVESPITDAV